MLGSLPMLLFISSTTDPKDGISGYLFVASSFFDSNSKDVVSTIPGCRLL